MKPIESLEVKFRDKPVGTLALSPDGRVCTFEYAPSWLVEGFSISPLELPLQSGLFEARPTPFAGNFGVFEDSLPDGYGRYLLHKALLRHGINDVDLTSLDRLSIVGSNGMGALTYLPTTDYTESIDSNDLDLLQEKALEVLREKQDNDAEWLLFNSANSGGARPKTTYADDEGHWLVKFRHTYDPSDMAQQEWACNDLARKCGIDVADFKLINNRYFASRRFDIDDNGNRLHMATAGGLLDVSLATPILDYRNLLSLTGFITQRYSDVEQMFRRMVFNYCIGNKDDHCKNFSFRVVKNNGVWRWRLAPAYDITRCSEGYNGEHATSVNGTGRPSESDFIAVGRRMRISDHRCREIIDEIQTITNENTD